MNPICQPCIGSTLQECVGIARHLAGSRIWDPNKPYLAAMHRIHISGTWLALLPGKAVADAHTCCVRGASEGPDPQGTQTDRHPGLRWRVVAPGAAAAPKEVLPSRAKPGTARHGPQWLTKRNGVRLVLFETNSRMVGPYLAAIHRIRIPIMDATLRAP
jgi:hypothetical protein